MNEALFENAKLLAVLEKHFPGHSENSDNAVGLAALGACQAVLEAVQLVSGPIGGTAVALLRSSSAGSETQ